MDYPLLELLHLNNTCHIFSHVLHIPMFGIGIGANNILSYVLDVCFNCKITVDWNILCYVCKIFYIQFPSDLFVAIF